MRSATFLLALLLTGCPTKGEPDSQARHEVATGNVASAGVCGPEESSGCGAGEDGTCGPNENCNCEKGAPEQALVPAARAKVGDRTRCPVSGGTFVVRPTTEFVSHAGKSYPVCCDGCATRFRQNPTRFTES